MCINNIIGIPNKKLVKYFIHVNKKELINFFLLFTLLSED